MISSLCPGCGEHAINYVTRICEKCGDKWGGVWAHLKLLQAMAEERGPLRDALLLTVAEDIATYKTGCTCGENDTTPPGEKHKETCPASKYGERYLEHLYRLPKEREAVQKADEYMDQQTAAIRRAVPFTEEDVRFVAELRAKLRGSEEEEVMLSPEEIAHLDKKLDAAGFTSEWANGLGKLTPEQQERFIDYAIDKSILLDHVDIRRMCPECGKAMKDADDSDLHVVCEPCGVRLIKDVTDAVAPGEGEVEVWHCPICDNCYTFRRLDLFPDAVVLAGDPVAPTTCFDCGAKLMQWACYRPFSASQAFKLAGRALDGSLLPRMDGEAKRRFAGDPDEPEVPRDDPFYTSPEVRDEYLRGRFGSKEIHAPTKVERGPTGEPEHVSGPEDARITFGDDDNGGN